MTLKGIFCFARNIIPFARVMLNQKSENKQCTFSSGNQTVLILMHLSFHIIIIFFLRIIIYYVNNIQPMQFQPLPSLLPYFKCYTQPISENRKKRNRIFRELHNLVVIRSCRIRIIKFLIALLLFCNQKHFPKCNM